METIVVGIIFLFLVSYLFFSLVKEKNNNNEEIKALDLSSKLLHLDDNEGISNYLFNKLLDLSENKFQLPVFIRTLEELNANENDKKAWACGKYYHLKGKNIIEQKKISDEIISIKKELKKEFDEISDIFPRIELSGRNLWTLAHELGHYLLDVDNIEQSELRADNKIYDIFVDYIKEDILFYIFTISLKVHSKNEAFNEEKYEINSKNYKEVEMNLNNFLIAKNIKL